MIVAIREIVDDSKRRDQIRTTQFRMLANILQCLEDDAIAGGIKLIDIFIVSLSDSQDRFK